MNVPNNNSPDGFKVIGWGSIQPNTPDKFQLATPTEKMMVFITTFQI